MICTECGQEADILTLLKKKEDEYIAARDKARESGSQEDYDAWHKFWARRETTYGGKR